jgi:hypothetical protein
MVDLQKHRRLKTIQKKVIKLADEALGLQAHSSELSKLSKLEKKASYAFESNMPITKIMQKREERDYYRQFLYDKYHIIRDPFWQRK